MDELLRKYANVPVDAKLTAIMRLAAELMLDDLKEPDAVVRRRLADALDVATAARLRVQEIERDAANRISLAEDTARAVRQENAGLRQQLQTLQSNIDAMINNPVRPDESWRTRQLMAAPGGR